MLVMLYTTTTDLCPYCEHGKLSEQTKVTETDHSELHQCSSCHKWIKRRKRLNVEA